MGKIFSVYIGNQDRPEDRFAQVVLPLTPYGLLNAMEELDVQDISSSTYLEITEYYDFEYLGAYIYESNTTLEDLNALAKQLATFDQMQMCSFEGLIRMEAEKSGKIPIPRIIDLAYSTSSCHVISDIFSDDALGHFYADNGFMPELDDLPDAIYDKLDFSKIGYEMRKGEGGVYTSFGYVTQDSEINQVYATLNKSFQRPDYVMLLELTNVKTGQSAKLQLPGTEIQLFSILRQIDCSEWSEAKITDYDGPLRGLAFSKIHTSGFEVINNLAKIVDKFRLDGELLKFKALLSYEECCDPSEAIHISDCVHSYDLDPSIRSPEDMARAYLHTVLNEKDVSFLSSYLRLYTLGADLLNMQHCKYTDYGNLSPRIAPATVQEETEDPQFSM